MAQTAPLDTSRALADVDPLLDTRAAASYIASSANRVVELVRAGSLAAVRDGRKIKLRRSELDRYIADLPAYEPPSGAA